MLITLPTFLIRSHIVSGWSIERLLLFYLYSGNCPCSVHIRSQLHFLHIIVPFLKVIHTEVSCALELLWNSTAVCFPLVFQLSTAPTSRHQQEDHYKIHIHIRDLEDFYSGGILTSPMQYLSITYMATPMGFEPTLFSVTSWRVSQLHYGARLCYRMGQDNYFISLSWQTNQITKAKRDDVNGSRGGIRTHNFSFMGAMT